MRFHEDEHWTLYHRSTDDLRTDEALAELIPVDTYLGMQSEELLRTDASDVWRESRKRSRKGETPGLTTNNSL